MAVALLSGLLACSHPAAFGPALAEQGVPGHPDLASAEAAGVRLTARAGGWTGWPSNLEDRLAPLEITLENRSGRSLRLRPGDFGLLAPNGFRYAPLSSAEALHAADALAFERYGVGWSAGFSYGPGWGWPGRPWFGPGFGFGLYSEPYAPWSGLPPSSQLLDPPPRGVLQDGGRLAAHLFFPVPARDLPQLELVVELVDDATGDRFGILRIPFLRKDGE